MCLQTYFEYMPSCNTHMPSVKLNNENEWCKFSKEKANNNKKVKNNKNI